MSGQRGLSAAPASPPALICGNASVLSGPSSAPAGAVVVPAGDNSSQLEDSNLAPNTTYWLAPGTHRLAQDRFGQIIPKDGDTFVGAPGAVLDGNRINETAFGGQAANVTITYLTIQNFVTPQDQGTVNHDMGTGWTVTNITATHNDGAAVMVGPDGVLRDSCLTQNGQYGFQGAAPQTDRNIVVDHNEISHNNTNNTEALSPDCGCSGGSKFWDVRGAVVTNNYVHHNMGAGLWADTNNTGFLIEGNYISDNDGEGIEYEISYNAVIRNNTFVRNGLVAGPKNPGFPTGAIYLSEAGSDSRVAGNYGAALEIANNVFTDNFAGVVLWENADRFCGSDANTSSDYCTLVNPAQVNLSTCNAAHINNEPYYSDCRWKTKNVQVHDNVFNLTPATIGSSCTVANTCGFQGVFSNWGTTPSWSPYMGEVVEEAISRHQNNRWYNNTYRGPWHFMPHDMSYDVNFATWQSTWGQDAGSTYDATPPPPTTSTTRPTTPPSNPSTFLFAEGSTLAGFREYLLLANPGGGEVDATVTYLFDDGSAPRQTAVAVPAEGRTTIDVAEVVGTGRVGVSVAVQAPALVVAQRSLYFDRALPNGRINGSASALGVAAPRTAWTFAEGSTLGGFQEYLTVQNPGAADATVAFTFGLEGGGGSTAQLLVPAGQRRTLDVNAVLGPGVAGHSTQVVADQPVVVERPFYFDRAVGDDGVAINGGHVALGSAPAASWDFAEGTVLPGFAEYLSLANPGSGAASAQITYILGDGTTQTRAATVEAGSRRTVRVFDTTDPAGIGRDVSDPLGRGVSVRVTTDAPGGVVAERSLSFHHSFGPEGEVNDGTATPGGQVLARRWGFAEGSTLPGFFPFLTIENPSAGPATVAITYTPDTGPSVVRTVTAPAMSRITVQVHGPAEQGGIGGEYAGFGIFLEASAPVLAESPFYTLRALPGLPIISGGATVVGLPLD